MFPPAVAGTLTPVAVAAEVTLGQAGVVAVVVASVAWYLAYVRPWVRRGSDDRLRSVLQGDGPRFPSPGCTTVTVYPHESSRPPLSRRLLERLTF